jgi:hypothetical protein
MLRFVARVPALQEVLDEHLADNFGEMLPHVFMADLTRWFVAAIAAGEGSEIAAFADAVEALYTSDDPEVRNVAAVSFMEYLVVGPDSQERAAIEALRPIAGPATAGDLAAMERYAAGG